MSFEIKDAPLIFINCAMNIFIIVYFLIDLYHSHELGPKLYQSTGKVPFAYSKQLSSNDNQ